jgi:MFS family permease
MLAVVGAAGSAGLYLDSAIGLLISRFMLGIATSGIVTAMITMISETFTAEARARILGYQSATGAMSGVAALFVAGWLGSVAGWRAPFGLYLLAVPVLALGIVYLPKSPRAVREAEAAPVDWSVLMKLWPIYLMIIPMFIAVYMPNIQVSFLLRDDAVIDPRVQSYVIMSGAFTVALGALGFGSIRKRLSASHILVLCFALQGTGLAIMGAVHNPLLTALGCGVLGFGTGIANPLISDMIVAWSTLETRSMAIGASYTFRYGGDFLNPLVMHPLGLAIGLHSAFIAVGALFWVGVVVAMVWRQAVGKPVTAGVTSGG